MTNTNLTQPEPMKKPEDEVKKKSFFTLGSQGLVCWAICTNMSQEKAIAHANSLSPTGISSRWQLSEDKFPDGRDNPHDCPDNPGAKHYMLNC